MLAALVTAALVVASLRPDGGHPAAATKTSTTCKAGVALTVAADPTVAAVIADIADAWSARRPLVDGVCPTVTVRSQSSADAASAFAKTNTTLPDVWIPDSTLWVDNLRDAIRGADTAANSMWLSGPIATSPLVLATAPGHAASVRREAAGGWRTVFAHPAGLRTADPETSTDGLVSLLTATAALNGSAVAPSRELVDSFVTMSRAVARSPQAGLQALAAAPADDYRVLVSEQDVLQAAGL